MEEQNLELSERVLNLERDLADSDQRYEKVSTENKQLLEELGRLLIDFAGQSDTFIFDTLDKRRLIIDDLCSQELRDTSANIKNIWACLLYTSPSPRD